MSRDTTRISTIAAALIAAAVLGLAACGADGSGSTEAEPVTITGAWARITPPAAQNGAVYLTIESRDGDVLRHVSVPPAIAATAQIHETAHHGGMTSMRAAEPVELPAGERVRLEPGGRHVMLMGLARPIAAGDRVPVTLTFERAGAVTVDAPAREG